MLTKKVTVAKLDLTKANIVTTGSYEYTGSAIAPTPIVSYGGSQLEKGIDYTVSYENNINASTSSSKAQVIVSGIGNCTGSVCASFAISPTSLAAATLSACGSYTYTGNAITPTPSVTLNGFGTLTKGKDFDYKYSDNQNAGANARVSVVGMGNFIGESAWTSFTIARCDLSAATISITSQSYEGRPVTPNPKVTINGKVLEKDRDYKVLGYANNNSAGTGKVTIEGINNYSGCREASFTIASPVRTSMITIDETPTYTGSALKPHITVRDGSKVLKEGTDYSLSYANNVSAGVDRASVTVTGKGNYAGTATKKFTIAQRPVSAATVTVAAQTYTGKALTPKPTVKVGSTTLREGTDYTLSYGGNVNVGRGSVTVVGKGNYTGSKKAEFDIVAPQPQKPAQPSGAAMHRLYNPNSGEHFYTASAHERDSLRRAGWKYEGVGWTAPATSRTPVYRLYSGTDHHYTTSAAERDMLVRAGWRYEGVGWYSDDAKGTPLYRQFNPNVNPAAPRNNSGSHNYTTSRAEHDHLVSVGWRGEGIGWYGM